MAVEDAYGAKQWREGAEGARRRGRLPHGEGHALDLPRGGRVRLPRGRALRGARLRRAEVDGLPGLRGHAQGGARRGGRAPSRRRLPAGADRRHLRGPADRRGRRAARDPGAQPRRRLPVRPRPAHVRLDRRRGVRACWPSTTTSASTSRWPRRRTAPRPRCMGKDLANPMAMLLACAAVLGQAGAQGLGGRRPRLARDLRERAGDAPRAA